MNVLSLFDGISCGQIALERANIKVDNYYASEIDKFAIKVTQSNYPNTKQLGDITKLSKLDILNLPKIDLVMGGSPCQSLSSANTWLNKGEKGVNGTGKSNLFWEFTRILNLIKRFNNPNVYFLFENVGSAAKKDIDIISDALGCTGVSFNSMLLSAQNRNRIYWSNISYEVPLQRKAIYLQELLESSVDDKYYLTEKMYNCIITPSKGNWKSGKMEIDLPIARPLTATMHKMHRADTDNYISTEYKPRDKTNVRRLTPLECERLQTLPDNYTVGISDTQRYKSIGNGWTVDVIAYILKNIEDGKEVR